MRLLRQRWINKGEVCLLAWILNDELFTFLCSLLLNLRMLIQKNCKHVCVKSGIQQQRAIFQPLHVNGQSMSFNK